MTSSFRRFLVSVNVNKTTDMTRLGLDGSVLEFIPCETLSNEHGLVRSSPPFFNVWPLTSPGSPGSPGSHPMAMVDIQNPDIQTSRYRSIPSPSSLLNSKEKKKDKKKKNAPKLSKADIGAPSGFKWVWQLGASICFFYYLKIFFIAVFLCLLFVPVVSDMWPTWAGIPTTSTPICGSCCLRRGSVRLRWGTKKPLS